MSTQPIPDWWPHQPAPEPEPRPLPPPTSLPQWASEQRCERAFNALMRRIAILNRPDEEWLEEARIKVAAMRHGYIEPLVLEDY